MKFYTNKISTGKALNFSDFIQKVAASNSPSVIKTAEKVKGEDECLTGKQSKLPDALKEKIIEKKIDEGKCEVDGDDKDDDVEDADESDESEGSEGEVDSDEESADKKSDGKKKNMKKEECYSSSSAKFVRIANLDEKTKSEWKNYWKKLYPSEYVDAMFADK